MAQKVFRQNTFERVLDFQNTFESVLLWQNTFEIYLLGLFIRIGEKQFQHYIQKIFLVKKKLESRQNLFFCAPSVSPPFFPNPVSSSDLPPSPGLRSTIGDIFVMKIAKTKIRLVYYLTLIAKTGEVGEDNILTS